MQPHCPLLIRQRSQGYIFLANFYCKDWKSTNLQWQKQFFGAFWLLSVCEAPQICFKTHFVSGFWCNSFKCRLPNFLIKTLTLVDMQQHPLSSWESPSKRQAAHSDDLSALQPRFTRHGTSGGSPLFFLVHSRPPTPLFIVAVCVQFVIALRKNKYGFIIARPRLWLLSGIEKSSHAALSFCLMRCRARPWLLHCCCRCLSEGRALQ